MILTIATTTLFIALNLARRPEIPLKSNLLLNQVAEVRCRELAEWSHNGWLKYTPKIFKKYNYAGENLALNFTDATSTLKALENSLTHKSNNHSKNYTHVGIANCNNKVGNVGVFIFAGK